MGDIANILGLGKSSGAGQSFISQVRQGNLGKSVNSQRRLRNVDIMGNKAIRRNLNQITTINNVKRFYKDGHVESRKIIKDEMADMVKKSDMIGRTESSIQKRLEDKHGFVTKIDGKEVKIDFSGKNELIKTRKLIGEAIVEKRASNSVFTEEEKKRNVRLGQLTSEMGLYRSAGSKLTDSREKQGVKKKFHTDSSSIGVKQAEYKIGIAGDTKSEGDLRGISASVNRGKKDQKFVLDSDDSTAGVAGDFGVKKSGDKDTMSMFQSFGRADSNQIRKL